ncbi:MAG: hydrogenase maturation protease, partial [Nitrososphaerota archaeon]|nr:hydrogenase maturation protease [Nitrososphaerota archaeon]
IFFDAADFGGKPGEIRILSPEEASGTVVSTHTIPLNAILEVAGIKAPSYVVGIQAVKLGFGEEMSDPVKDAGKIIVEFLREVCGQ